MFRLKKKLQDTVWSTEYEVLRFRALASPVEMAGTGARQDMEAKAEMEEISPFILPKMPGPTSI